MENQFSKWKFVDSCPAINFVNSVNARSESEKGQYTFRDDKFNIYEDILDWGVNSRCINQFISRNLINLSLQYPIEAAKVFERAKTLRESLFRVFKKIIESSKPQERDLEVLNFECTIARSHQKMVYSDDKYKWKFISGETSLDVILWEVALSASEIITSNHLMYLKQCSGEDCGWLFMDTSKNKTRQWCDMKSCGNLEKVRRFRARLRLV